VKLFQQGSEFLSVDVSILSDYSRFHSRAEDRDPIVQAVPGLPLLPDNGVNRFFTGLEDSRRWARRRRDCRLVQSYFHIAEQRCPGQSVQLAFHFAEACWVGFAECDAAEPVIAIGVLKTAEETDQQVLEGGSRALAAAGSDQDCRKLIDPTADQETNRVLRHELLHIRVETVERT